MKEFKGTPGPWHARYNGHYMDIQQENDCLSFASVHENEYMNIGRSEMESNAKLMAVAPELLELAFKYKADLLNMLHQSAARDNRIAQIDEVINKALS